MIIYKYIIVEYMYIFIQDLSVKLLLVLYDCFRRRIAVIVFYVFSLIGNCSF